MVGDETLVTDTANDLFRSARMALVAARPQSTDGAVKDALVELISGIGESSFARYLQDQGLGSFWHQRLVAHAPSDLNYARIVDELKLARSVNAAAYMAQLAALRELDRIFDSSGIAYLVFKGAHVRELVYADPSFRPANDIDILVSPTDRHDAIQALVRSGFVLHEDAANISHEVTLVRGPIMIDLHWDILRPGRTRIAMCEELLKRRRRINGFWCLADLDAVFVMLVHPPFVRYVTMLALCNVVDFEQWLRTRTIDWDELDGLLTRTGLRTAAWTMITWLTMLRPGEGPPIPADFVDKIRPGRFRRAYLAYWLRHDMSARLWQYRPLIQLGFTLCLHDTAADAIRAVSGRVSAFAAR